MTHDAGISARPDCENQPPWIKAITISRKEPTMTERALAIWLVLATGVQMGSMRRFSQCLMTFVP